MSDTARLISPEKRGEDVDVALRPQTLDDFTGQKAARANLKVFIEAARGRGEALDHVLFVGPPGLGKTTLAQIMAKELGVNFRATSGPVIAKAGDLAALLTIPAFILIVATYIPGSCIKARVGHPMLLGVKFWALAHLIANGSLADLLLFGGFLAWATALFVVSRKRDRAAGGLQHRLGRLHEEAAPKD